MFECHAQTIMRDSHIKGHMSVLRHVFSCGDFPKVTTIDGVKHLYKIDKHYVKIRVCSLDFSSVCLMAKVISTDWLPAVNLHCDSGQNAVSCLERCVPVAF